MARGRVALLLVAKLALTAAFQMGDSTFDHTWQSKADMPENRSDLTATTVGDAIYLIGGCEGNQEWSAEAGMYLCSAASKATVRYAPATNTYVRLEDAPVTRYRHAAAAAGTKIYLFGGVDVQDNVRPQVDVFDTVAGTWSSAGAMPNATTDLMAVAVSMNGEARIFVMGGYYPPSYVASDMMMIYSPANSTWTAGPSLVQARGDASAAVAGGKVYVLGGFYTDDWNQPLSSVEMLDPALMNGGWTAKRPMIVARADMAVASLHDVLHVMGGETKNGDGQEAPLTDVGAYDAAQDRWYPGGNIHSHRFRFVAAAHGNSIYIFGGQGYLSGTYGTPGSEYPVYKMVEQYEETVVSNNAIEASSARGDRCGAAALLGSLLSVLLPRAA